MIRFDQKWKVSVTPSQLGRKKAQTGEKVPNLAPKEIKSWFGQLGAQTYFRNSLRGIFSFAIGWLFLYWG